MQACRKDTDELCKLEEYFYDWSKDKLDSQQLDQLYYDVNVSAILQEKREVVDPSEGDTEDTGQLNTPFLYRGVVWGVMKYLEEKKQREAQGHQMRRDLAKYEFIKALEEVVKAIGTVFDRVQSSAVGMKYQDRLYGTGISDLSRNVEEFLEEIKEEA